MQEAYNPEDYFKNVQPLMIFDNDTVEREDGEIVPQKPPLAGSTWADGCATAGSVDTANPNIVRQFQTLLTSVAPALANQ